MSVFVRTCSGHLSHLVFTSALVLTVYECWASARLSFHFSYSTALFATGTLGVVMSEGKLFVRDSRTLREYEIPITRNAVPAGAFGQIMGPVTDPTRIDKGSRGLKIYDPGLANTATIESSLLYM